MRSTWQWRGANVFMLPIGIYPGPYRFLDFETYNFTFESRVSARLYQITLPCHALVATVRVLH